jgi:uncharacterized protein GlcG (DUF336 family)
MRQLLVVMGLSASLAFPAQADEMLSVSVKRLTVESALKIAQATLQHCREQGIQIGVTVVDRGGHPQVVLRDTVAPDLTLTISRQKAYTALSFMAATSTLEDRFKSPFAVGKVDGLVMSAGGVPIEAGGILYGAVGVSGAPEGTTDEECALAGIEAIKADLEMSSF